MNIQQATIGLEVVRSKGDYVVGYTGTIIAIDAEKNRAQINWNQSNKTWVSFSSLEPTSIPYRIEPEKQIKDKHGRKGYDKWVFPKYIKL
jgi:hypothetical protein